MFYILLILLIIFYLFDFVVFFVLLAVSMALPAIGHQGQGGVICCFLTSIPTGERPLPANYLSKRQSQWFAVALW